MPGTIRIYDPGDKDLQGLADGERKARVKAIDAWWGWREGRHPDVLP
jgi:hypothetical protein